MQCQASNITTAGTTLASCYDERGHEYKIPSYCWSSEGPADLKTIYTAARAEPIKSNANIKNAGQDVTLKVQVNPGVRNFLIAANTSNSVAELKAMICKESTIVSSFFSFLCNQ